MPDQVAPTDTTAIVPYQVSEDTQLSATLTGLSAALHNAAERSILGTIGPQDGYTDTERMAMIALEELRLVRGFDLYAITRRGELIRDIEERGLWSRHPNGFASMEEAAAAQGISKSEYSNIRDMTQVIFPYMRDTMGLTIAVVFENINKSNMRELVPVLKALITGEAPASGSTREAVNAAMRDAEDGLIQVANANGEGTPSRERVRNQAVSDLLTAGEQMNNRDLRARLRPSRTPAISPAVVRRGDQIYFTALLTEDQLTALTRKLGPLMEAPIDTRLPDNARERAIEVARIRVLRDFIDQLTGG